MEFSHYGKTTWNAGQYFLRVGIKCLPGHTSLKTGDGKMKGCTFATNSDIPPVNINGGWYKFFDTAGLNEADKGAVPAPQAMTQLMRFLKNDCVDGLNLVIMVMKPGAITNTMQRNAKLMRRLTDNKVPILFVVTYAENEHPNEQQWEADNRKHFDKLAAAAGSRIVAGCFSDPQLYPSMLSALNCFVAITPATKKYKGNCSSFSGRKI